VKQAPFGKDGKTKAEESYIPDSRYLATAGEAKPRRLEVLSSEASSARYKRYATFAVRKCPVTPVTSATRDTWQCILH
jgi:hypothetical protein